MPIITEKYGNPRWGFLHGLGASSADEQRASILLRQQQVGAQIAELRDQVEQLARKLPPIPADKKNTIASQLVAATAKFQKDVNALSAQIQQNVELRGLLAPSLRTELARKIAVAKRQAELYVEIAKRFKDTGVVWGIKNASVDYAGDLGPTSGSLAAVIGVYYTMARDLDNLLVGQMDSLSGGVFISIFGETVGAPLARFAGSILDAVESILNGLGLLIKAIGKVAEAGGEGVGWLADNIWLVLGIGAAFFILPPLIRIGLKGKREGFEAALEETGMTLQRGSENIKAGAAAAGRGIKSAADAAKKAAMAYGSGGASLAVSGAPRYYRPRPRRRY